MTVAELVPQQTVDHFRHEALLYEGDDGFLAGTLGFVQEGLARGEPVLVVVAADKIELLSSRLGADAERVRFRDMTKIGGNPARIIPVWQQFVDDCAGRVVRGIGEPMWAGRTTAERAECELHEALLNVAFEHGSPWWLRCPYDVAALPATAVEAARQSHPILCTNEQYLRSHGYRGERCEQLLDARLPEPTGTPAALTFRAAALAGLRRNVVAFAMSLGLPADRIDGLVLAVHEVASNSIRHGGGTGRLRMWSDPGVLVCEIQDQGRITTPLVGRQRPPLDAGGGRGLWLVNQLCDLVQIRSSAAGTTVRLQLWFGEPVW